MANWPARPIPEPKPPPGGNGGVTDAHDEELRRLSRILERERLLAAIRVERSREAWHNQTAFIAVACMSFVAFMFLVMFLVAHFH